MKNYLLLLKQVLVKNKGVYISKTAQSETQDNNQLKVENKKILDIANSLGLDFTMHS